MTVDYGSQDRTREFGLPLSSFSSVELHGGQVKLFNLREMDQAPSREGRPAPGFIFQLPRFQAQLPKSNYVDGHLALVPAVKVEVTHLMDPTAPQSPFAAPWSLTPHPTSRLAVGLARDGSESMDEGLNDFAPSRGRHDIADSERRCG